MTSIRRVGLLLLGLLVFAAVGFGQTSAPATEPIQVTAGAVSLPGINGSTLAGTLAGMQFNITPNVGLESVNFISTASPSTTSAYMAGYSDGHLGNLLSKALNNSSPWLNGYNFRLRLHADAGAARISDASGSVKQSFSGLFGGQFDYAIKGSPTWSLAVRVDDLFTKGLPKHNNLVVALGPVIHF